jgi:glycosyltransferase involved in cell wall biosynthesis
MNPNMKKKIVIFIDWYVPAYRAGGPIRSVLNITSTFGDHADFYIITSNKDLGEEQPLKGVKENNWTSVGSTKVMYLNTTNQTTERYKKLLTEIQPDVVYFNSLFSKNFTLMPLSLVKKETSLNGVKIILAPRGMLGKGALAIKPLKKKLFFLYVRFTQRFKNITWHASTQQEVNEIQAQFSKNAQTVVAENLAMLPQDVKVKSKSTQDQLKVLFVSRISVKKNLQLVVEAIAKSKHKRNIQLTIIGGVEEEAYFKTIESMLKNEQIEYHYLGAIPQEQLREQYENSHLFCLPSFHENYGHAIVEALSFGLPILISQHTPWRNLQEKGVGFDLPLEVSEFTKAIDIFVEMGDEEYANYSKKSIEYSRKILLNPEVVEANRKLFLGS